MPKVETPQLDEIDNPSKFKGLINSLKKQWAAVLIVVIALTAYGGNLGYKRIQENTIYNFLDNLTKTTTIKENKECSFVKVKPRVGVSWDLVSYTCLQQQEAIRLGKVPPTPIPPTPEPVEEPTEETN